MSEAFSRWSPSTYYSFSNQLQNNNAIHESCLLILKNYHHILLISYVTPLQLFMLIFPSNVIVFVTKFWSLLTYLNCSISSSPMARSKETQSTIHHKDFSVPGVWSIIQMLQDIFCTGSYSYGERTTSTPRYFNLIHFTIVEPRQILIRQLIRESYL